MGSPSDTPAPLAQAPSAALPRQGRRAARRARPAVRAAALVCAPLLVIGVLTWPLLFTGSVFRFDWLTHLWFIWQQSLAIRANHMPSFFINDAREVFYPTYAFYGGTIYTLAGSLSLALGNAPVAAYVLTYLLAFAAAYGGWYWIARMAGLGRWLAQAPGLVFVTSAYYLQIVYSSGDWPAFVAVSTIPLLIASALSVLRADRLRIWPAIALAASGIVFFGSHNITILWGSTFMALTALALIACVPELRRRITRPGVTRVAGLLVPALLVNAWYLLPTLAYASHTWLGIGEGKGQLYWEDDLRETMSIVSPAHLFTLSRAASYAVAPGSAAALPILAIGWVLVSIAIFLRTRHDRTWMRILLVACGMAVLIGVVMTHAGLILALPQPYTRLQYSVRLESFLLMGVSGAVLASLVLARGAAGRARHWTWALVPVLAVSAVAAAEQVAAFPPSEPGVSRGQQMQAYERPQNDYADGRLPRIEHTGTSVTLAIPPSSVHGDRATGLVRLAPGQLVDSNIGGGPELVHVTGARIVGLDSELRDVLEIAPNSKVASGGGAGHTSSAGTETISLSTAEGLPIVAGRLLTLGAVLVLIAELALVAARDVRAWRA